MYTTDNFAQFQSLDLSKEIALINPQRTPFLSFLLQMGKTTQAEASIINWYEETLGSDAISTGMEGQDAPADKQDTTALLTNYTELLLGTAKVSCTAQASNIVGVNNLMERETLKKLTQLKYALEDRIMTGTKAVKTVSVGQKMNGLLNQVNAGNVVTATGEVVTAVDFNATVKKMYDAGTNDNMICFISDINKKEVNGFYDVSYMAKDKFLGFTCDKLHTEYGDITFVLTPSLALAKSVVIVNPDYIELKELQKACAIDLAITGDSISKMVKVECALKLSNSKGASKLVLV